MELREEFSVCLNNEALSRVRVYLYKPFYSRERENAKLRGIVYVEWASRVNFMTIFGDLYQNKLWVICNNLNQFAHLSSASGPSNDVIKMAALVLLMYTYKTTYLKQ